MHRVATIIPGVGRVVSHGRDWNADLGTVDTHHLHPRANGERVCYAYCA